MPNDQIIIVPSPPLNVAERKIGSGTIGRGLRASITRKARQGGGGDRERADDHR